jgi:hypothetical protein
MLELVGSREGVVLSSLATSAGRLDLNPPRQLMVRGIWHWVHQSALPHLGYFVENLVPYAIEANALESDLAHQLCILNWRLLASCLAGKLMKRSQWFWRVHRHCRRCLLIISQHLISISIPISTHKTYKLTVMASQVDRSTFFDSAKSAIRLYAVVMERGAGNVPERANGASMSALSELDSLDMLSWALESWVIPVVLRPWVEPFGMVSMTHFCYMNVKVIARVPDRWWWRWRWGWYRGTGNLVVVVVVVEARLP